MSPASTRSNDRRARVKKQLDNLTPEQVANLRAVYELEQDFCRWVVEQGMNAGLGVTGLVGVCCSVLAHCLYEASIHVCEAEIIEKTLIGDDERVEEIMREVKNKLATIRSGQHANRTDTEGNGEGGSGEADGGGHKTH